MLFVPQISCSFCQLQKHSDFTVSRAACGTAMLPVAEILPRKPPEVSTSAAALCESAYVFSESRLAAKSAKPRLSMSHCKLSHSPSCLAVPWQVPPCSERVCQMLLLGTRGGIGFNRQRITVCELPATTYMTMAQNEICQPCKKACFSYLQAARFAKSKIAITFVP
jgi:hypothetical protein